MTHHLEEFIKKNKNTVDETLKCGCCDNLLIHCGEYEVAKVGLGKGKKSEEGIVCQTCKKHGRQLVNVIRLSEDNNRVFKVAISQILAVSSESGGETPTIESELAAPPKPAPPITNKENNNNAIPQKEEKKIVEK